LAGSYDWKMFDVKSFIAEHNLQNRVQLLGFVDDVDLPLLYHLSKIFCFISFDEGFGLPPLEAMASGKPVIVANKGSLPEVCGSAGIYVDPNNPKQIGEAITKLISSPTRIIEMSAKGLKQASNFSWKKTGEEFLKMFKYVSEKE
jgi:glycosyltransferase involved in cell wall biosynthesis